MKPNKKAEKSQLRPELIRENSNAQKVPKEKTIAFYLIAMRMGGSAEGKAGFISLREDCHCVAPPPISSLTAEEDTASLLPVSIFL